MLQQIGSRATRLRPSPIVRRVGISRETADRIRVTSLEEPVTGVAPDLQSHQTRESTLNLEMSFVGLRQKFKRFLQYYDIL
jgi:hypothetical protein